MRADRLLLDVDAPVRQVGQRPYRSRQVLDIPDGEAMVAHHRDQHALGHRAARVPSSAERVDRLALDDLEVVVPLAHGLPQRRVGGPGFFRGGGRLGPLSPQFRRDRHQMLEHVGGDPRPDLELRQTEAAVGRVLLRVGQGDLQLSPAAGRLPAEEVRYRHRQRGGQLLDQRELRFPASVLEQGQGRGSAADPLPQLGERQTPGPAQMTQPLTKGYKVYTIGLNQILAIFHREADYILLLWKNSTIFTPSALLFRELARQAEVNIPPGTRDLSICRKVPQWTRSASRR